MQSEEISVTKGDAPLDLDAIIKASELDYGESTEKPAQANGPSQLLTPGEPPQQGTPAASAAGGQLTPDAYDFVVPDDLEADQELLGEFKTLAARSNISPETARKIMDLQVKNATAGVERWNRTREGWNAEIISDREFGGERLEKTKSEAKAALDFYDPSGSLLKELSAVGYGSHPGIVRFLARVGRNLRGREDHVHSGREQRPASGLLRDALWPD